MFVTVTDYIPHCYSFLTIYTSQGELTAAKSSQPSVFSLSNEILDKIIRQCIGSDPSSYFNIRDVSAIFRSITLKIPYRYRETHTPAAKNLKNLDNVSILSLVKLTRVEIGVMEAVRDVVRNQRWQSS